MDSIKEKLVLADRVYIRLLTEAVAMLSEAVGQNQISDIIWKRYEEYINARNKQEGLLNQPPASEKGE